MSCWSCYLYEYTAFSIVCSIVLSSIVVTYNCNVICIKGHKNIWVTFFRSNKTKVIVIQKGFTRKKWNIRFLFQTVWFQILIRTSRVILKTGQNGPRLRKLPKRPNFVTRFSATAGWVRRTTFRRRPRSSGSTRRRLSKSCHRRRGSERRRCSSSSRTTPNLKCSKLYDGISVIRLGYFRKFLAANFLIEVAQILICILQQRAMAILIGKISRVS